MAVLTILCESIPRRTVTLTEIVTTVGRSVDNVLEVPDPNMSRRHCVIEKRDDGDFVLTDCNSSNGTRVNGEKIISHELRAGDRIELGSTTLLFALDGNADSSHGSRSKLGSGMDESNPLGAQG